MARKTPIAFANDTIIYLNRKLKKANDIIAASKDFINMYESTFGEPEECDEYFQLKKLLKQFYAKKMHNIDFYFYDNIEGLEFDGFEVDPMSGFDGKKDAEPCEEIDADFYSVFIHLPLKGRECIADCPTKKEAERFVLFLRRLCKQCRISNSNFEYSSR